MIVMGPEEYASHIKAFPKDATYINVPIANYMELEEVYGEGHAIGEWAKYENCQASLRTQQIYLEDEEPSGFIDAGVDASQVSNSADVKFIEDSIGKTKRPSSSSAKGCDTKKKE